MNELCEGIRQQYQVNVIIIEGRHFALKYKNTKVVVSIGKKKKTIHAKSDKTDSPYFNDFCVFQFLLPLNILLDKILTVKVYEKSVARVKKLVGGFKVDLATVWTQPNHQFYHKWAVLENPKNPLLGVRGFLKCDIGILSKGILIQPLSDQEDKDVWENNILVPHGAIKDRIRTRIVCSVYRADSFSFNKDNNEEKVAKLYIKMVYCDNVGRTKIAKNKGPPIWNEEIIFNDLFPPLSSNLLIEICDRDKAQNSGSLANTKLDIRSLYEDGKDGFLPTFGPNFVYLYQPLKKRQHHRNVCTFGNKFTYFCRLLMAIRTETIETPEDSKIKKKKNKKPFTMIPPIFESKYFEYNKFILFAAIFDVLFFESNYRKKNIQIRLTMGPKKGPDEIYREKKKTVKIQLPTEGLEPPKNVNLITQCNITPQLKCSSSNDYSFTAFSGRFPCVSINGDWPNTLRKMYQSNIIKKVIQNCKKEINEIKYDLQFDERRVAKFSDKLKRILSELSKSCQGILLHTNAIKSGDTNLFRERRRVNHREIADIAKKTKIASMKKALEAEKELNNISAYLKRLTKFAQDPENSFPDTEIWLSNKNQIIAQCTIKTEEIAFSSNDQENGLLAGKPQTIIIRGKKNKIKAKLDILIWFGLAENFTKCLEMLPSGFQQENNSCSDKLNVAIPSQIVYTEEHHFQCRAHIFQAGIAYGFDNNGLVDSFVRIIVLGQSRKTQIRKKSLSPIWKETLFFPEVILYGPSLYIKNNSVTITAEVFDRDYPFGYDLIGRSFVVPVVKLKGEAYAPPKFPPKLKWENIISENKTSGRILMVVELLEISDDLKKIPSFNVAQEGPLSIPPNIQPHYTKYRLEIIFWGVRQIPKKKQLRNQMFVTLESSERFLKSPVVNDVKSKMNFPFSIKMEEVELPEEADYAPPLSVKLYHIGSITRQAKYVANSVVPSIRHFYVSLLESSEKAHEKEVRIEITSERKALKRTVKTKNGFAKKWHEKKTKMNELGGNILFLFVKIWRGIKCKTRKKCVTSAYELKALKDDEKPTWWVKYNASTEGGDPGIATIKIYHEELEGQPQFESFMDYLHTFDMVTGNQRKIKKGILKAKVKIALKLYKIAKFGSAIGEANRKIMEKGILWKSPTNVPEKVIVRVYAVCAKNLPARDIYGKSDPYLFVKVGKRIIKDRKNYKPKQLNPTFGKCFEFKATFPEDYLLRIKVIDYDKSSKDDLIGETTVDLENRYYSKYHASCGIPKVYELAGYNTWRDIFKPSEILKIICERASLKPPVIQNDNITIEGHKFLTPSASGINKQEIQALEVLKRWQEMPLQGFELVPEHVETRSLYNSKIPGIEQGKLVMWVDIFPADYRFLPPKVDITPRSPEAMELRAIVWNVDNVVLHDTSMIFKEKTSDIYVRGWILSLEEEMQKTDIHFRSLDGEGNFNWRFIFHFNYIPTERKMTVGKKMDAFDLHPEERKVQCKLEIQIWDNNTLGKDDFLGTLILELCAIPKGAKLPGRCTLKMLAPNAAKINLFKIRKTRGWWPFRRRTQTQSFGNEFELTGKIDLELEILTEAEAKMSPAGRGREEPNALPPPNRPVTSFNWLLSPGKVFRHIIWRKVGKFLIFVALSTILLFFILILLYSFPNYLVKKILRA